MDKIKFEVEMGDLTSRVSCSIDLALDAIEKDLIKPKYVVHFSYDKTKDILVVQRDYFDTFEEAKDYCDSLEYDSKSMIKRL